MLNACQTLILNRGGVQQLFKEFISDVASSISNCISIFKLIISSLMAEGMLKLFREKRVHKSWLIAGAIALIAEYLLA
jgi:hypothetical protein